ncbi:transforming growth factor-beta receptor-associated protein 1 [Conger conger]|uniref:transforming growth factor-beta receptor-associated protein 1 n=1 Tax=Conger conger TaxID=82655 RepID=UPI002A5993DC|nr:transforming growth factor-beta receptor-associated protein 1 [Conger conger]
MSLKAFIPSLVLEKPTTGKERDKSSIQCLEACGRNLYIGGKDSLIQHFVVMDEGGPGPGMEGKSAGIREVRRRQLGSRSPISQLGAIPFLNHLLVLSDGSLSALNMFSLEPLPGLRRIRSVSFFHLHGADVSAQPSPAVELFTLSARRRSVNIHSVWVDRWDCLREVSLPQEPLSLAVDRSSLCVAAGDRYFLHDHEAGATLDLFPHDLPKQGVIVNAIGKGEFLLHGPGSLGMFVTRSGVSGRPPIQWSEGVLGAVVHFPYVLTLCSEALHIYSMLDQRIKQTIPLSRAKGLFSTPERVFAFSEREVLCLSPVALEEQIKALVASQHVDAALDFVQGVQSLLSKDTYKVLHNNLTCTLGFVKFYQERFSEAKYLFIEGNLDPREIIALYPEHYPVCKDFVSQHAPVFNAKDLRALKEDCATFERYQSFLTNFLREVQWSDQSHHCRQDVDGVLLKLYLERGNEADLVELLSSANACVLNTCVPYLECHKRFYALGLLYQSHSQDENAIQTWVNIVDGDDPDGMSSAAYEQVVNALRQQKSRQLVWKFADWALQKSQEVGVQIFTSREEEQAPFEEEEVLSFLNKHHLALALYLEHLIFALKSKKERHHTLLAMTYVTQVLGIVEKGEGSNITANSTREKLQQFLWKSTLYSTVAVQEQIQATSLHLERAILHGVAGEHRKALEVLVHGEKDLQAAEDYCRMARSNQAKEFGSPLYHLLLNIYLDSPQLATKATDLLNRNAEAFDPVAVLRVLPGTWSMPLVSRFLSESVRGLVHRRKMGGVERNLAKVEHFRHKCTRTTLTRGMIKVERDQVCQRCGRYLNEPEFLRSLKGELIHTHCWSHEEPSA